MLEFNELVQKIDDYFAPFNMMNNKEFDESFIYCINHGDPASFLSNINTEIAELDVTLLDNYITEGKKLLNAAEEVLRKKAKEILTDLNNCRNKIENLQKSVQNTPIRDSFCELSSYVSDLKKSISAYKTTVAKIFADDRFKEWKEARENNPSEDSSWNNIPKELQVLIHLFLMQSCTLKDVLTFRSLNKKAYTIFKSYLASNEGAFWFLNYIEKHFHDHKKINAVINFCKFSKCYEKWQETTGLFYFFTALITDDINKLDSEKLQQVISIAEENYNKQFPKVITSVKLTNMAIEYKANKYSKNEDLRKTWASDFQILLSKIIEEQKHSSKYEHCPTIIKNCGYVNLAGAHLKSVFLDETALSGCNLKGAKLQRANLSFIDLSYANLQGVDLTDAKLTGCTLNETDFTGAILDKVILHGWTQAFGAKFIRASFIESFFYYCTTYQCDFTEAQFEQAELDFIDHKSTFTDTRWDQCEIRGKLKASIFFQAKLEFVKISADISGADFTEAHFKAPEFVYPETRVNFFDQPKCTLQTDYNSEKPPIFKNAIIQNVGHEKIKQIQEIFSDHFKSVSLPELTLSKAQCNKAITSYQAYKDASFFGIKWLASSKKSYKTYIQLREASTDQERHLIALNYIKNYPETAFAQALFQVMPNGTKQELLNDDTNTIFINCVRNMLNKSPKAAFTQNLIKAIIDTQSNERKDDLLPEKLRRNCEGGPNRISL